MVTGSSRGIGKAIAIAFANEGAKVALTGRNMQRLEQVAAEIWDAGGLADCWRMDVSREAEVEESVRKITDRWGRIDILVNNAAIIHPETPVEVSPPGRGRGGHQIMRSGGEGPPAAASTTRCV